MDTSVSTHDDVGRAVLDAIRQPLLAVDARRRIVLQNERAAALLEEGTLLRQYTGRRLHAPDADNDHRLGLALCELANGRRDRWAVQLAAPGERIASVQMRRLVDTAEGPLAALTVLAPMPLEEHESVLADSFNLTPAEARVAGYLARGLAPKQVAALCGVSPCTVRSQVRTLFEKTGARRQPDLVRLLLLAAMF